MANTYTQLYTHIIFAVKGRSSLISPIWEAELYKYITGTISNKNQKMMIINGMPDHVHILVGLKPDCNLSDLIRDVKVASTKWIHENKHVVGKFEWQTGFGAFSVSQSGIDAVIKYILNQKEHHNKKTFKEEYTEFLKAYQIDFKPEYIFKDIEDKD
ncbi:IS200/IS605 family transposase [Lacihabitans lacunae]|uniref:IS200/IS605 family transposase n=1 Tax=Lacihabitans lacunae TaxID=1028214 RepID=A0ABV7YRI3_9BACT